MLTRRNGHSLLWRCAFAAGLAATGVLLMHPLTAIAQDPQNILPDPREKQQALLEVRPETQQTRTTNELLVFLKPGQNPHRFAARHGMRARRRLHSDSNAYVMVTASPNHAEKMLSIVGRDPETRRVFKNERIEYRPNSFVPDDPYFAAAGAPNTAGQWHLLNAFTPGLDARVQGAWDRDLTGFGVRIGIVDDGLDWEHPDLVENVKKALCQDFWDDDTDPSPHRLADRHGTSVAGVAAARGGNGVGVTGAAPYATLAGLRIELNGIQTTDQFVDATLWKSSGTEREIDVKNHSYGVDMPYVADDSGVDALSVSTITGGTIHTFSAGNARGKDGADANKHALGASPNAIAVAAVAFNGKFSSYSSFGANVFVTAPSSGGSFGILTTDRQAADGYNPGIPGDENPNTGFFPDAFADTNYTSIFGGTSSAAPLVAGVMALGKQAQSLLDTRLAKHVLARTSDVVDASDSTTSSFGGWRRNAAGYRFNPNYGFGLIDADGFTKLAPLFDGVTALETETTGIKTLGGIGIPDNNATGYVTPFTLNSTTPLEEVQLYLDASHGFRGDLEAILTSPRGTKSKLFCYAPADHWDNINWTFTSNAFWGENPRGTWYLTVRDVQSADTGTVNRFKVTVRMGRPITSISGQVYNDTNGNASWNSGEPALANRRVYIDADNDGVFDTGERSVVTLTDGKYAFNNLPAAVYHLRLAPVSGWRSTQSPQGAYTLDLNEGRKNAKHFGVTTSGRVSGLIWNDTNGNGIRDNGEPLIGGVRVFADANRNGGWDSGEASTVSSAVSSTNPASGLYAITGLVIGTHEIRVAPSSGWRSSSPSAKVWSVNVTSGATLIDRHFGLTQRALLIGSVWNDADKNGLRGTGEPGIGALRVYLDTNNNGLFDAGESSTTTSSLERSLGAYSFNVAAGNYVLRVAANAGIIHSLPKAGYHSVSLGAGAEVTRNFGLSTQ